MFDDKTCGGQSHYFYFNMKNKEYTYGNVWELYRRNFRGIKF